MIIRRVFALFALALIAALGMTMASCGGGDGGGGGGGGGGGTQAAYDIQLIGPSATGAQINRPFSMTLNFFAQSSANPINVISSETLSVTKASGPGNLGGTLALNGPGASSLTFNNLILDQQGSYTLQVTGTSASVPVVSMSFDVGPQMDLVFTAVPSTVYRPRTFSVTVSTLDPGTSAPVISPYPISITVDRNQSSGTGSVGGANTLTLSGASALAFSGLVYSVDETATLQATAAGFNTAISSSIVFDSLVLVNASASANPLINGNFTLSANIQSATTSLPVAISPPISVSASLASGTGTLSGTTSANSSGSSVSISGARYNDLGPATFTLSSTEAASATTGMVSFSVSLTVTANGPTVVTPGNAPGPFTFSVRDGQGAVYGGAVSQLAWSLINTGTMATAQSGNAAFSGGNAGVTLASISTLGNYRLDGAIASPSATPNPASINVTVSNMVIVNAPGPFAALKSVRVGTPYNDTVSFLAPAGTMGYGMLSGTFPPGLTLNTSSGDITGTPTTAGAYKFTLFAQLAGANVQPLRCALAVFSVAETEIVSGQQFVTLSGMTLVPGPYGVGTNATDTFSFNSSYDSVTYPIGATPQVRLNIWYPNAAAPTPWPMLVHHRGRGFNWNSYHEFGRQLSSWGILYVSVEDYQSFFDGGASGQTPNGTYDNFSTGEQGMESSSAFIEAAMNRMLARSAAMADLFYQKIDPEKVVISGHSRGGGGAQATLERSYRLNVCGCIIIMAVDLRYYFTTVSGSGNVYPIDISNKSKRTPALIIAAENDGDVNYPFADEMFDRITGPATFGTLYGGCHAFFSDTGTAFSGGATITRAQEMRSLFNIMVAFIRRWTGNDISLEGYLYNNELAGSSEWGLNGWRNTMETIRIDDFQDGNAATNLLGGANSLSAGSRVEQSIYPNLGGNMASLGIRHNQITLASGTNATYSTSFAAQDVTRCKRLAFRIGQTTAVGYDWTTIRVRLTDSSMATSTVTIFDRTAQAATYLPDFGTPASNNYDRFVDAMISLANFTAINRAAITSIELIFETDSTTGGTRIVYTDDIRFE